MQVLQNKRCFRNAEKIYSKTNEGNKNEEKGKYVQT